MTTSTLRATRATPARPALVRALPLAVLVLGAGVARPAAAQAPIALDRVGPTLQPATWSYRMRAIAQQQSLDLGTRRVALTRGAPGWMLVVNEQNPTASALDSLSLGADLAPRRRVVRARTQRGPATLELTFSGDSVTGAMTPPQGVGTVQRIRTTSPKGAAASDAVVLVALGRAPLAAGWQGAMTLPDLQSGQGVPLTLRVVRREKVTVPVGAFDAWVVEGTSKAGRTTYWVAPGTGVVKTVATVTQPNAPRFEAELTAR